MGIKSVVYRGSGRGSLRVKTINPTVRHHRAGTPAKDISITFYCSSFLLHVSLLCVRNGYKKTETEVKQIVGKMNNKK